MKNQSKKIFTVIMLSLIITTGIYPYTLTPEDQTKALREQEYLFLHEKERLDAVQRERTQRELEKTKEKKELIIEEIPTKEAKEKLPKFKINQINLKNARHLARTDKHWLTAPYIGTEMDVNDLNTLVRDITNTYIKHGYITTRAYIPKQNLKSGALDIIIIEGKITDIVFEDKSENSWHLATAFPFVKETVLNIRKLEQGLDQLNRLQSKQATLKFLASDQLGGTKVVIVNRKNNSWTARMNYDNNTNHPIRFYPHSISVSKDNLFNLNDSWHLGISQDNGENSQYANSGSVNFSLPFGYTTFSAYYSQFDYMSLVNGQYRNFTTSGQTKSNGLGLSAVIYRNQLGKTTLEGNLGISDTTSYIEDVKSEIGSRKIGVGSIGISQTLNTNFGFWTGSLKYHQGLKGLADWDLTRDDEKEQIDDTDPKAQFNKTTIDISLYKPFQFIMFPVTLRSNMHAQYNKDTLYSNESITIGGLYTIRGFNNQYVQGDIGYYMRNELTMPFGYLFYPWQFVNDWTKGLQVFGAYDFGYVESIAGEEANLDQGEGRLDGIGLGLRYYGEKVTYDLTWTYPLRAPDFIEKAKLMEFYFNVSMSLI